MPVKTLDHLNIRTPDVPRTATFFRDVLGLEPKKRRIAALEEIHALNIDGVGAIIAQARNAR